MKRIVILVSGRGSNMQALVQAARREAWPATIAAVIADRPEAEGLAWARAEGLATALVDFRAHDRPTFDAALVEAIEAHGPVDLVVLAGFMRILGEAFTRRYAGRLINIHPSLLPAFAGLRTHQRALDAGCRVAGATVHFVTAELDHGPIVIQGAVPVRAGDDAARLAARVLAVEHQIYPQALAWWARDELVFDGPHVQHRHGAPQWLWVDDDAGAGSVGPALAAALRAPR